MTITISLPWPECPIPMARQIANKQDLHGIDYLPNNLYNYDFT